MSEAKTKVNGVKLNPCKVCGTVPRIEKIKLEAGDWGRDAHSRSMYCFQVECKGFRHMLVFRHQDKNALARLWHSFNYKEKFDE